MDNPSVYLGPGYWASMHIASLNAKNYNEKCEVSRMIARMIAKFPCLKCRKHAMEYSLSNPFREAINDPDETSLFRWVWKFHNSVNKRLDKPEMNFEDALLFWGGKEMCSSNCDT